MTELGDRPSGSANKFAMDPERGKQIRGQLVPTLPSRIPADTHASAAFQHVFNDGSSLSFHVLNSRISSVLPAPRSVQGSGTGLGKGRGETALPAGGPDRSDSGKSDANRDPGPVADSGMAVT